MAYPPRRIVRMRLVSARVILLAAVALVDAAPRVAALRLTLSHVDVERAISLARWPHTDAERAAFHSRYIADVSRAPVDSWTVDRIELITEFRRLELMAEEHARINDTWGRGGLREVDDDIKPWRGRVTIVAHLSLRATGPYVGRTPIADIVLDPAVPSIDVRRSDVLGLCGAESFGCPILGGTVEQMFDAAAIGDTTRTAVVIWNGKELGRCTIDFARIE